MYIIQFGGYTLPTEQLDMSETQGASRRAARSELAGVGGSLDAYGVGPDPLAGDSINKAFIIEAASPAALQTAVDGFLGEMLLSQNDPRQGLRLLVGQLPDGTKRQSWAKCVEARAMLEWYHPDNSWLPVQATFERPWPVWEKFEDLLYFGDHLGTFEDSAAAGWTFGQAVTVQAVASSPTDFTITNGGNARVMRGIIEFVGAVANPTVINTRNKYSFSWDGQLLAADRLTIDLASFDAKKNGVRGEWPNITLGTARGQLLPMILEPGANPIRIEATSPNCSFRFYWARSYT